MEENPYSAPVSEVLTEEFGQENEPEMASIVARFLAFVLDMVMFFVMAFLLGIVLAIIFPIETIDSQDDLLLGLGVMAVFSIVNLFFLIGKGQTIGKMIMRIRIVNKDSFEVPCFVDVILKRYVLFMVLSLLPLVSIAVLIDPFMIFRESRQCWHDEFANTIVIKD